jgi:hypothetical protein
MSGERILNGLRIVELQRRKLHNGALSPRFMDCARCEPHAKRRSYVVMHCEGLCETHAHAELADRG